MAPFSFEALKELFAGTSDAVFAKAADGRYFMINEAGANLAGGVPDDFVGKTDYDVFSGDAAAQIRRTDQEVCEARKFVSFELKVDRPDGFRTFLVTKGPILDEAGKIIGVVGIARETTETKRTERRLRAHRHTLEILALGAPIEEVLTQMVRAIETEMVGVRCSILILNPDGKHFSTGAAPALPAEFNRAVEAMDIGPYAGSCGTAVYRGEEVIVTDTLTDPLWSQYREISTVFGIRACWSVPVVSKDGKVLGTFAMYTAEARSPTPLERQLVKDGTALAAIVLEHFWLKQSLAKYVGRLQALAEASKTLAEAQLDLNGIILHAVRWLAGRVGDGCMVHLLSQEHPRIKTAAFHHVNPDAVELAKRIRSGHFLLKKEATDTLVREGKSVLLPVIDRELAGMLMEPDFWPYFEKRFVRSLLAVPLRASGKTIGILTAIRDQTEVPFNEEDRDFLQEFADRFAQSVQSALLYLEAQTAVKIREDFMAVASHELKTPLTPLKIQLHLLARVLNQGELPRTPMTDEILKLISGADQQIKKLVWLIEDMLEVSRISAGRLMLKRLPTDLGTAVREVCDRFAPELAAAKCPVVLKLESGLVGEWDPLRIEQIVTNLLTNAMKYGAGKPIEVSVWGENNDAKFSIRDHGIGIAPSDQGRIFERFERAVTVTRYGGLGLGLFIARQIVEAHHGRITLKSAIGKGTTFTVELPRHVETAEQKAS